jgi:hypothetical protein
MVLAEVEGPGGVRLHAASNRRCLGTTEAAAVLAAAYGAARLAAVEKALATSMDAEAALRDAPGPPGVRGQAAIDADTSGLPQAEQPALREAPTFSPGHTSQLARTLERCVCACVRACVCVCVCVVLCARALADFRVLHVSVCVCVCISASVVQSLAHTARRLRAATSTWRRWVCGRPSAAAPSRP